MRRFPMLILAAAALGFAAGCGNDSSAPPTRPGPPGTSAIISSGSIAPGGGSFTFTFPDTGTTGYHCGLHPSTMRGNSVTVTSTSPNDSMVVQIVSLSAPGYSPSATTIKPGGYVRWVNVHTMTHSVEND